MRISVFCIFSSGSGEVNFALGKIKTKSEIMTEVSNQVNSSGDKVASLMREAENLKVRLEEERQKLNDVTCKQNLSSLQKQKLREKFDFSVEHR